MQGRKKISDELKELGSPLAGMPHSMPYDVPAGYFSRLPDAVLEKAMTQGLSQTNSYPIPARYFDALPLQMLAAAKKETYKKNKTITLKRQTWWQVRLAAAAVLLLSIGLGIYQLQPTQQPVSHEAVLATISHADIKEYIGRNSDEFDVFPLAEAPANSSMIDECRQLESDDIISYLDENGWSTTE